MGWLGWTLLFLGLALAAAVFLGLTALRLWRSARALGRDVARAADALSTLPLPRPDLSDSE